ncbi:MAG: hybrid sensor histidine kinase/response regulator, partial [Tidjanibacter sp.]|nr:hybrid sensor histidine kinase/response regulator [Tidjanibacter sp.]
MKSFRSILILCYLSLAGGVCASGQTFSAVRQYDVKAGISDNTVRTIVQDYTGHLWFGTKDGINRFNGSTISRFGSYPRTSDQPLFNILKLCPHANNRQLWVATVDGLYLFDTIEGTFDFFDKKTIDNKGVASVVNDVCYDATGALWIATSNGLFCYEEKEDALRYYHSSDQKGSLPSNTVICILRDSSGDMWFGTRAGLAYYRRGVDKFTTYCWTRKNMSSLPYEIGTLMETSEGDIWIGTRYDGLMHLDRTAGRFTSYPIIGTSEGNTWVRAIHQLDNNTFLIGTEDGLFVFDHSTKEITHQPALGTESIYDFITDREGGLWIGTYFAGAYYISPQSNSMHWYREGTSALHGSVVSQFCEDSNGNLWIATENGGLNHFNTTT